MFNQSSQVHPNHLNKYLAALPYPCFSLKGLFLDSKLLTKMVVMLAAFAVAMQGGNTVQGQSQGQGQGQSSSETRNKGQGKNQSQTHNQDQDKIQGSTSSGSGISKGKSS
jgi:hypothetical protein